LHADEQQLADTKAIIQYAAVSGMPGTLTAKIRSLTATLAQ
jgi:hypothetical protein